MNYGLLWGMVAYCFGPLGFPAMYIYDMYIDMYIDSFVYLIIDLFGCFYKFGGSSKEGLGFLLQGFGVDIKAGLELRSLCMYIYVYIYLFVYLLVFKAGS